VPFLPHRITKDRFGIACLNGLKYSLKLEEGN